MEMWHSGTVLRITHRTEWYWENRDIWLTAPAAQTGRADAARHRYRLATGRGARWWSNPRVRHRQWVDMFGFPISENAILTERWERQANRLRVKC
jgi:hypothetical protein